MIKNKLLIPLAITMTSTIAISLVSCDPGKGSDDYEEKSDNETTVTWTRQNEQDEYSPETAPATAKQYSSMNTMIEDYHNVIKDNKKILSEELTKHLSIFLDEPIPDPSSTNAEKPRYYQKFTNIKVTIDDVSNLKESNYSKKSTEYFNISFHLVLSGQWQKKWDAEEQVEIQKLTFENDYIEIKNYPIYLKYDDTKKVLLDGDSDGFSEIGYNCECVLPDIGNDITVEEGQVDGITIKNIIHNSHVKWSTSEYFAMIGRLPDLTLDELKNLFKLVSWTNELLFGFTSDIQSFYFQNITFSNS